MLKYQTKHDDMYNIIISFYTVKLFVLTDNDPYYINHKTLKLSQIVTVISKGNIFNTVCDIVKVLKHITHYYLKYSDLLVRQR